MFFYNFSGVRYCYLKFFSDVVFVVIFKVINVVWYVIFRFLVSFVFWECLMCVLSMVFM